MKLNKAIFVSVLLITSSAQAQCFTTGYCERPGAKISRGEVSVRLDGLLRETKFKVGSRESALDIDIAALVGKYDSEWFKTINIEDPKNREIIESDVSALQQRVNDLVTLKKWNVQGNNPKIVSDRFFQLVDDKSTSQLKAINEAVEVINVAASTELACRADTKCMGDRAEAAKLAEIAREKAEKAEQLDKLISDICSDTQDIHDLWTEMREERSNPSGVVNLKNLHSIGQCLQLHQSSLNENRKEYRRLTHKTFTLKCIITPTNERTWTMGC